MWPFVLGSDGTRLWVLLAHFANSDHRCILWGSGMVALEPMVQAFSSSSSSSCYYLEYLADKWLLLYLPAVQVGRFLYLADP